MSNQLDGYTQTSLALLYGDFRPSDREIVRKFMGNGDADDVLVESLKLFLTRWKKADWSNEYHIERLGKWFGRNGSPHFMATARASLAKERGEIFRLFLAGLNNPSRAEMKEHA